MSSATFYRERKAFTTPEVTAVRRGKRAAYLAGQLQDYAYPADAVAAAQKRLPQVV